MSLKEELERAIPGVMMWHIDSIKVIKDVEVHGENGVLVTAVIPRGQYSKTLEATYLTRLKMEHREIALDFYNKLDKMLKGTLEEV